MLSIWRCDHDRVAVEILDPKFKVPRVRIDVAFANDRSVELTSAGHDVLEIVDFEPEQNAVADRLGGVSNGPMMMFGVPVVKLQNKPVAPPFARVAPWVPQSLIFGAAMPADTPEQSLVP